MNRIFSGVFARATRKRAAKVMMIDIYKNYRRAFIGTVIRTM